MRADHRRAIPSRAASHGLTLVFAADDGSLVTIRQGAGGLMTAIEYGPGRALEQPRSLREAASPVGDEGGVVVVPRLGRVERQRERRSDDDRFSDAGFTCGHATHRAVIANSPQPSFASRGCPDKGFRFHFAPVILQIVPRHGVPVAHCAGRNRSVVSYWIRRQPIYSGPPMTRIPLRGCCRRAVAMGHAQLWRRKLDFHSALDSARHRLSPRCGELCGQDGAVGWRDKASV